MMGGSVPEATENAEAQMDDEDMLHDMDEEENGQEEGDNAGDDPLVSLPAFKQLVIDILEKNDLSQKRAAKMECIDFLNLLSLFNAQGIHFK